MNWIQEVILKPSTAQTLFIICLVAVIGIQLGKLKILKISLGITFIFFVGIVVGHFNFNINSDMLHFAQSFGLILFVYMLGLQVGPGFFSSLKKGGLKLNLLALSVVFIGLIMAYGFHFLFGVSLPNMMGLLSGAVTNTPALGAAQQAMKQIQPNDLQSISDMAMACAVTYPLGVVGVIIAIVLLRSYSTKWAVNPTSEPEKIANTYVSEFSITNPAIMNLTIQEVMKLSHKKCVITRIWRNGIVTIPTSGTQLMENDHLLVMSTLADVQHMKTLFGKQEQVDWNKNDIDWNQIDNSHLISRRIVVTHNKINGAKLGSLKLRNNYGINITRVNRIGIDLLPSPDLALQIGDRITVVGEAASVDSVVKILGDEMVRLDEPNLIAVFMGILFGLLLGALPFSFPGMSMPVKLGIAGGPIVIGILMGAFGPRLKITTYTTQSANAMLRQFGLMIYLACLGIDAGGHFLETIMHAKGILWIGIGFALTLIPILIVGILSLKVFRLSFSKCVGMLCGSMANPIALNYANSTLESDEPSVCYATVYPLTMFVHIVTAQLILMFLL